MIKKIKSGIYQGTINRNIYVKTSRNVYAYQLLGGGNDTATAGLNFIPPLSCFFQNSVNIPDDRSSFRWGYHISSLPNL